MFHISKSIRKKFGSVYPWNLWVRKFRISKCSSKIWVFTSWSFFSYFSQSSENSTGDVFHLFKLKFSLVTSLVLLSKRKISKKLKKIAGFRTVLFGSRIDLYLVSTKSRVTTTFRKIGPPLFSSSGNQSFRYTVRFTSTLSFECSCVRPVSPVPYRFRVLQPFRVIAFAYFSFRVRSVEFVSWSRFCCWLGLARVQFVCFSPPFSINF